MPLADSDVRPALLDTTTKGAIAALNSAPGVLLHKVPGENANHTKAGVHSTAEIDTRPASVWRDLQRWEEPVAPSKAEYKAVRSPRRSQQRRALAEFRRLYSPSRRGRGSSIIGTSSSENPVDYAWMVLSTKKEECFHEDGKKECLQEKRISGLNSGFDDRLRRTVTVSQVPASSVPSLMQVPPTVTVAAASRAPAYPRGSRKAPGVRYSPPGIGASAKNPSAKKEAKESQPEPSTSSSSWSKRFPFLTSKSPSSFSGVSQSWYLPYDQDTEETEEAQEADRTGAAGDGAKVIVNGAERPRILADEEFTILAAEKPAAGGGAETSEIHLGLSVGRIEGNQEGEVSAAAQENNDFDSQRSGRSEEVPLSWIVPEAPQVPPLARGNLAAAANKLEAGDLTSTAPEVLPSAGVEGTDIPARRGSSEEGSPLQQLRICSPNASDEQSDSGMMDADSSDDGRPWAARRRAANSQTPQQAAAAGIKAHEELRAFPNNGELTQDDVYYAVLPWAEGRNSNEPQQVEDVTAASLQVRRRKRQSSLAEVPLEDAGEGKLSQKEIFAAATAEGTGRDDGVGGGRNASAPETRTQAHLATADWTAEAWPVAAGRDSMDALRAQEGGTSGASWWMPWVPPRTVGYATSAEETEIVGPEQGNLGGIEAMAAEPTEQENYAEKAVQREAVPNAADLLARGYRNSVAAEESVEKPELERTRTTEAEESFPSVKQEHVERWREGEEEKRAKFWPPKQVPGDNEFLPDALQRQQHLREGIWREQVEGLQKQQENQRQRQALRQAEEDQLLWENVAAEANAQQLVERAHTRKLQLESWTATLKMLFFLAFTVLFTSGIFAWMVLSVSKRNPPEAIS